MNKIRKGSTVYYVSEKDVYRAKILDIKKIEYEGVPGKEYQLRILKDEKDKENGRPAESELEFYFFEPKGSISKLIRAPSKR